MANCTNEIKELMALYYDNELSADEKQLVDEHVASCKECAAELNMYKEIHEELFLDDVILPEGFHNDLMGKLNAMSQVDDGDTVNLHDEKIEANTSLKGNELSKVVPLKKQSFYKRYNKYLNVAAMLVFVVLLGVIGLTRANEWQQDSSSYVEDTAKTSDSDTSESADEMAYDEMATADSAEEMEMADSAMDSEAGNESNGAMTRETDTMDDSAKEMAVDSDAEPAAEEPAEVALNEDGAVAEVTSAEIDADEAQGESEEAPVVDDVAVGEDANEFTVSTEFNEGATGDDGVSGTSQDSDTLDAGAVQDTDAVTFDTSEESHALTTSDETSGGYTNGNGTDKEDGEDGGNVFSIVLAIVLIGGVVVGVRYYFINRKRND